MSDGIHELISAAIEAIGAFLGLGFMMGALMIVLSMIIKGFIQSLC